MPNLENLGLYFAVYVNTVIDGDHLKKNILNYMPKLNKLTYNICSIIYLNNKTYLPSIEHIQSTLTNLGDSQIIASVDYFPKQKTGQCHIYSHPYTLRCYNRITNNFPGGLFEYVQEISLFDERPFEHDFFIQISQSFPFLKKLSLTNETQQKMKQHEESNNENENLPIIKFLHLTQFDLLDIHNDYIAQFLMDTKTCLPIDLRLSRVNVGKANAKQKNS
ncbi:unnamed protein product [Rotaria sp. Silwood2]|nr:unnamed protein product [Rotaria sp. Silwood2]